MNDHDFVEAETFPNEMAAAVAAAFLAARRIKCVVERQDSSGAAALSHEQIVNGLEEIRRRRRHVWILAVTYLPATGLALWAAPEAAPYVAGLWMFGIAVTVGRAGYVRCPRCGNGFSRRCGGRNDFTQECLHCGLRLR